MATASVSRNPFINPPASKNPFLSRVTTSQSSTPSNSQAAAAPEVNVPLPPSPEPQVTELPSQASVDIPVETPASSTPPALPPRRYAPPPGPPPSVLIAAADTSPAATPAPRSYSPPPPSFRAESPPPYTASPDYRTGEQLLELGPARPFQNRRPVLPPQQPRYVAPNPTGRSGGSWSASVNGVNEHYTGSSRFGANGSSSSWAMFPGTLIQNITGVLNSPYLQPQSTGRSASRSHPELSTTLYEPPSGRPPRSNESGLRSSDPDDGTPTTVPTPGRPLLRNGKVLVYPQGYECPKCHNMGYKNLDPSHPCSKCWQKYGTPYTGALTYAPWSNPGPNSNYQRPLPRTLGPAPRPPLHTRPTGGRSSWGGSASPLAMPPPVPWANHPGLRGATSPGGTTIGFTNRPPPGALVVQPGDPRIGGRLCWKCGGDGEVLSFPFIIDRCRVCDGLGRIV